MNHFTKNILPHYSLIAILLLVCTHNKVSAQNITDSKNISLIGKWTGSSNLSPSNMLVKDDVLILATDNYLHTYDLKNIQNLQIANKLEFPFKISGLYSKKGSDSLFVLSSYLALIDISNPINPKSRGGKNINRKNLQSQNNNLIGTSEYVITGGEDSLIIYDSYLGSFAVKIGHFKADDNITSPIFIHEYRDLVITRDESGTRFVDFSNPYNRNPSIISEFKIDGKSINTSQIEINKSKAYLTLEPSLIDEENFYNFRGLSVWDISNPDSPKVISKIAFPENENNYHTYSIITSDGLLFIGEGSEGENSGRVKVIDISNDESPVVLDTLFLPKVGRHLAIYQNYLFVSDRSDVYVIDYTNPYNLAVTDTLGNSDVTNEVLQTEIVNDVAIAALGNQGVEFIDVSDPEYPKSIYKQEVQSSTSQLHTYDDYLFMNDGTTIRLLNISSTTNPEEISTIDINTNYLVDIHYSPPYLLVFTDELLVFDYSNATEPVLVNNYPINNGRITDVSVSDEIVSLLLYEFEMGFSWSSIELLNINDVQNIQRLHKIQFDLYDFKDAIYTNDGGLYLLEDNHSLIRKYDITNSATLVLEETYNLQDFEILDIRFDNEFIFIVNGNSGNKDAGIWTFDYHFNPVEGYYTPSTSTEIHSITIVEDYIYTSWGKRGLYILDKGSVVTSTVLEEVENDYTSFTLSGNYPNPFNPTTTIRYHLINSSNVKLSVYDILGRELETLVNKNQNAGTHDVLFSADNYASGIYFYRLEVGNQFKIGKMILSK